MMGVPFPLAEIYHYVLVEGWRIEELWRRDGEIRLVVYMPSPGVDKFRKLTGHPLEDCLSVTKHLQYSLYEADK